MLNDELDRLEKILKEALEQERGAHRAELRAAQQDAARLREALRRVDTEIGRIARAALADPTGGQG